MKKRSRVSLVILCFMLCSLARAWQAGEIPAKDRMVIVVSLDGFPAYDLEDPKLPVPTLRQLIKQGAWVKRMQPVNPTVTWPNHTTMVTGVFPKDHGLLYNGTLVRSDQPLATKVDWSIKKEQMVHSPTLYDLAHQAGLTTAQVDWVAINDAPTITWAFPEKAKLSDPLVQEMIGKGALQAEDVSNEHNPTILWRDQIWTKAGAYLIREHQPNLLLFHLLTLDSTHHNYGPRTLASYDAIAFLDSCVKQLLDAVKAAGMEKRTTLVIVSDHGFKLVEKQIGVKALLASANLNAQVQAVSEGGSVMIYVDKKDRTAVLARVRGLFAKTEGVEAIADESQYASLGLPSPSKDPQMADLVVYAKSGYAFVGGKEKDPIMTKAEQPSGAHGYLNTDPEMQAIFIAAGYGVKPRVVLDEMKNLSVAPTLAHWLGISLPRAEASACREIWQADTR